MTTGYLTRSRAAWVAAGLVVVAGFLLLAPAARSANTLAARLLRPRCARHPYGVALRLSLRSARRYLAHSAIVNSRFHESRRQEFTTSDWRTAVPLRQPRQDI
jgi:hypothetical protein